MKYAGCWVVMSPADRADAGNQAEPIHKQNKNKNGREEPERLSDKIAPDDVLEKAIKTFDQPFPKILCAAGDSLDFSHRQLGENDNSGGDDPGHQHRVRNRKLSDMNKCRWFYRERFMFSFFR